MSRKEADKMILKFAVKEFLDDRKFANLSLHTLRNYKRILTAFETYCISDENIANLKEVTRGTIKGFLNYCRDKGNSPETINGKLRVLKVFFNYAIAEDFISREVDLFRNIKFSKSDERIDVFTDKHVKQILHYFDRQSRNKPFHAYRNKIAVITMLGTGMRRGELCNLRWVDVDFGNHLVTVFGKKRKAVSIPIAKKLRKELADYYVYVQSFFDGNPSQYVFCTMQKGQLSSETIGAVFKRLNKLFNFEDVRLSAHTFRHSFASRALKNGMDAITLQRMLRHETLQMTQRYVNMWGADLSDSNEKHNPLNDIDL